MKFSFRFVRQRFRSRWRCALARLDVAGAFHSIFLSGQVTGGGSFQLPAQFFVEVPFEKRNAPAATGTGGGAFADLRRHAGFVNANVVHNLAFRHMKAKTDLIVEFQGRYQYSVFGFQCSVGRRVEESKSNRNSEHTFNSEFHPPHRLCSPSPSLRPGACHSIHQFSLFDSESSSLSGSGSGVITIFPFSTR